MHTNTDIPPTMVWGVGGERIPSDPPMNWFEMGVDHPCCAKHPPIANAIGVREANAVGAREAGQSMAITYIFLFKCIEGPPHEWGSCKEETRGLTRLAHSSGELGWVVDGSHDA